MPERFPPSLQQQIEDRLKYYEDLGIQLFYKDRVDKSAEVAAVETRVARTSAAPPILESALPKSNPKPAAPKPAIPAPAAIVVQPTGPSLFEAAEKIVDDTLLKIREDLGDCTRCRLHKGRNKLVYGDGNPKA